MNIHKWNPEKRESLCGKKTGRPIDHLHFCNEFLYDPAPDEMKCQICMEREKAALENAKGEKNEKNEK